MKKTVLAFAVAAAMGVPAVAAADTTLYGLFHVSVDRTDSGATSNASANEMNSRASRIGVRGSEDLGGGLRGVFQMEASMDPVATGGSLAARDSFVGLAGDFGAVHLGNVNNVHERVIGTVQVFGDSIVDARTILAQAPGIRLRARPTSSIFYASPNFSGFQVMAHYAVGSRTDARNPNDSDFVQGDDNNGNNQISVGATYSEGPLRAFGAYTQMNMTGKSDSNKGFILGGSYTIDDLRVGLAFDRVENDANSRNGYLVSAHYGLGQAFLMGMYGNAGEFASGTKDGATYYGVGAGYNFSRRTSIYAAYAKVDNDNGGKYNLGGGPSIAIDKDAPAGFDVSSFSIGVRHSF